MDCQAPLSTGFFRQEYWSGFSCSPPGYLPDSGIKPMSLMSPALAGRLFTSRVTWEAYIQGIHVWFLLLKYQASLCLPFFLVPMSASFLIYSLVFMEHILQCRRLKRCRFNPWVRKVPWRKAWQTTRVFLPGESHGQRRLVGYSPQGHKELDTTEMT